LVGFAEDEKWLKGKIAECTNQEQSAFNIVKASEYVTLIFMITAMALLIALAWRNF
jgi:hypothetical protein